MSASTLEQAVVPQDAITSQAAQGFVNKTPLGQRPMLAQAQMQGQITPQTAYAPPAFYQPIGEGKPRISPDMPPQQAAKQYFAAKRLKDLQQTKRAEDAIWMSMQQKAIRMGTDAAGNVTPANYQAQIKRSYIPAAAQEMMQKNLLGWNIKDLNDDEYIMALRLTHANRENMSPEQQQVLFGQFSQAAQERPELMKKLRSMMESEQKKAKKK